MHQEVYISYVPSLSEFFGKQRSALQTNNLLHSKYNSEGMVL